MVVLNPPSKSKGTKPMQAKPYYVRLVLSGTKPKRFQESTTLPTFLDWNTPCICRVPKDIVQQTLSSVPKESSRLETVMCTRFCKLIRDGLLQDDVDDSNWWYSVSEAVVVVILLKTPIMDQHLLLLQQPLIFVLSIVTLHRR